MNKPVTVIVTTWLVPFGQIVKAVKQFDNDADALTFINDEAKKWWDEFDGDRCVAENVGAQRQWEDCDKFEPIRILGYDTPYYTLWGSENGFHAMLDEESYWRLHEEHYKREYDDKGISRPGYLRNAYGEDTSNEVAEIQAFYSPHH